GSCPPGAEQDQHQRIEGPQAPLYTPRMPQAAADFDRLIRETHDRFVRAMNARLDTMDADTTERYFRLLSKLRASHGQPGKTPRDVRQELMPDAMSIVLQEMQG